MPSGDPETLATVVHVVLFVYTLRSGALCSRPSGERRQVTTKGWRATQSLIFREDHLLNLTIASIMTLHRSQN